MHNNLQKNVALNQFTVQHVTLKDRSTNVKNLMSDTHNPIVTVHDLSPAALYRILGSKKMQGF